MKRKEKSKATHSGMATVHPNAAAIDIGATMHMAAVGADRTSDPVQPKNCSWQIFEGMRIAYSQWHDARSCSLSPSPDG